jgi:hypothetical protein
VREIENDLYLCPAVRRYGEHEWEEKPYQFHTLTRCAYCYAERSPIEIDAN